MAALAVAVLLLAGCLAKQNTREQAPAGEEETQAVGIDMVNAAFEVKAIEARADRPLIIQLHNKVFTAHTFTPRTSTWTWSSTGDRTRPSPSRRRGRAATAPTAASTKPRACAARSPTAEDRRPEAERRQAERRQAARSGFKGRRIRLGR
jgi:hypothetical protein